MDFAQTVMKTVNMKFYLIGPNQTLRKNLYGIISETGEEFGCFEYETSDQALMLLEQLKSYFSQFKNKEDYQFLQIGDDEMTANELLKIHLEWWSEQDKRIDKENKEDQEILNALNKVDKNFIEQIKINVNTEKDRNMGDFSINMIPIAKKISSILGREIDVKKVAEIIQKLLCG